jgi:hypothetical protein
MTMKKIILAIIMLLTSVSIAEAVGPLVGNNCLITQTLPTIRVTGEPISGVLTTNIWIMTGIQTIPAIPPKFVGVTGPSFIDCSGLDGQFTVGTAALEAGNPLVSPFSNMFPFVVMVPNPATGFVVDALGRATWPAVTTYTDTTVMPNPVSYELWIMPSTATAPSGPPTMTVTGTSAQLTGPVGKYNAFIKVMTTPTLGVGNSTSESVALMSPFAVSSAPAAPTNVIVK